LFRLVGLRQVILFQLATYASLLIFYLASGWILKRFSSRTLVRLGLLLLSISWSSLVVLKEKSGFYLIPLGIIFGAGYGNFWSGFNLSQYILIQQDKRESYFGKSFGFTNIAAAIGPFLGGLLIVAGNFLFAWDFAGYYLLFLLVFVLNLGNFLLAARLPRHSGIDFSFRHILAHKREPAWKLVLVQQFILGLYDVAFGLLVGILIFLIVKSEATLGGVNTIMALLTAGSSFFAASLLLRHKNWFWLGSFGISLGILSFAVFPNWWGIVLLGLFSGLAWPFLNIPLSVAILATIDKNRDAWQKKYHMFIERDGMLAAARVLNYLLLYFLLSGANEVSLARFWMLGIVLLPIVLGVLLTLSEQKIGPQAG